MNKIIQFLEKYFVPVAGKIGSQRHLVAIRDGFVAIMPLIILGSFAVLINGLPFEGYQDFMVRVFGEGWTDLGGNIWKGSFAILSLLVGIGISYNLAKSYDVDGLSAALVAFGSLIIMSPVTATEGGVDFAWTGAQGLFVALIVSIVSTEIFRFLIQKNFTIKMPKGVPTAVARSFAALLPATVVFIVFGMAFLLFTHAGTSLHKIIFDTIQEPLQGLSNTLPSAIIVSLLIHLLWFFGLHGTNIIGPIMETIYLPSLETNMAAFKDGVSAFSDQLAVVTKPFFDVYVHLGGAGATLALIVAIFLVAKSAQYRSIGKITAPAGVFNINEPVLFGVPIVLNPILLIPFVLIPIVLTCTSFFAISMGLVPKTVALVPWSMPPIFSGYLASGGAWQGVALQIFNFLLAVAIYIPFIKVQDIQAIKAENGEQ
ncbi:MULTISPECIES: PTS cellobiose transporter subunit IIC [Bacillus]|uniref:PTS cellobiose transporter subunit IIC n=1 Tax=Bacillus TaxID=1386 RepID=UPI0002E7E341|nr:MULTISPECIES: PTS cellobiose transporter subunit IIC [Bacillus]